MREFLYNSALTILFINYVVWVLYVIFVLPHTKETFLVKVMSGTVHFVSGMYWLIPVTTYIIKNNLISKSKIEEIHLKEMKFFVKLSYGVNFALVLIIIGGY